VPRAPPGVGCVCLPLPNWPGAATKLKLENGISTVAAPDGNDHNVVLPVILDTGEWRVITGTCGSVI
jgi:hypothetical protein